MTIVWPPYPIYPLPNTLPNPWPTIIGAGTYPSSAANPATTATQPAPKKKVRKTKIAPDTPVHVLFVIDSSGSMYSKARDVREGFNAYVETLRADTASDYRLTAVTFDTHVKTLFTDLPLAEVPPLDERNYAPGGNTALLDALGVSLDELTAAIKTPKKPYGKERALVIVMTDGEENSSRRFTKTAINAAITARTDVGNWTFVYLGESVDVWADASSLGFSQGNTVVYNSTTSSATALAGLAVSTQTYSRSGAASNASFGATIDPAALGVLTKNTNSSYVDSTAGTPPVVIAPVAPTPKRSGKKHL